VGNCRLPWARVDALKDYYGIVKIVEDFPEIQDSHGYLE
jgi:alpha-amylase/alpha-mannosidase (GH57 family)